MLQELILLYIYKMNLKHIKGKNKILSLAEVPYHFYRKDINYLKYVKRLSISQSNCV